MKPALTWFFLFALALPAQAMEFRRVLSEQSHIGFLTSQMGMEVPGSFRKFHVDLAFDPARPASAQARIEIDMTSVDAGSRQGNDEVKGADWFNIAAFPRARFESSSVHALGKGRYEVRGRLTIRGQSRDVKARFSFRPQAKQALFEGQFSLRRLDFGIGQSVWGDTGVVADVVRIQFRLVADGGPAIAP